MSSSKPVRLAPPSVAELEIQVCALQRQLQQAEETIRALKKGVPDSHTERLPEQETQGESERRLQMELTDTKLLQNISALLIHEENVNSLYVKITEAALTIMHSDFASMQMFHPERGEAGTLLLLASCGFDQAGKDFWAEVDVHSGTTCSIALRRGQRYMSSDLLNCEYVKDTPDHGMFAVAGVVSAQSTPLCSRTGKLLGMISTHWKHHHTPSTRDLNLLDILARQAADLIERKLAEEALQQSKHALTIANHRKDEFLATLAHELRNPLSPIRNGLHILRATPLDSNASELLAMMDRQATHLVRLIDDLLDVSRISQGRIELRRKKITLQNAIQDGVDASYPLIATHAHTLKLEVPDQPLWIYADITRISQIVSNLLNNAAKYTLPGGTITVIARGENAHAVLRVSDTGIGIAPGMLPHIFELFAQVDRNRERAQGGLGIGLALVRQLLEMHGGEIQVESPGLNQGSTFTVRLPLAAADEIKYSTRDVTDANIPSANLAGLRVLVVDDDVPSAQTIGWMLEMEGHEARTANNANDAITAARQFSPDVILLDIGLPDMSGYDLCRELRKDKRFKNTLLVAQTGWGQDRDRQHAKDAGFDHHLVKPFSAEQLSKLLTAAQSKTAQNL